MTKQQTTATIDTTDDITAAERAAQDARERAEQARRIREEAQRQIQQMQAQIAQAELDEREAGAAERQAANDRLAAERRRMADEPINLAVARALAEDLLELAEGFRQDAKDRKGQPIRDAKRFWTEIDNLRCRLATPDVDDDARELVLTLEWCTGVADRWEKSRFRAINNLSRDDGDIADGLAPPDDRRFQASEKELKAVLDGTPPKQLERVGELIASNIPPSQMAKMLGFVQFGGVSEADRLGAWVDRAFQAAGVERGLRRAVVEYSALNLEEAWQMRQSRAETGIPDRLVPGVAEEPGKDRPGRTYPVVAKFRESDIPRRRPTIVVPADGSLPEDMED